MGLSDELLNSNKKDKVVNDCCNLMEAQLASKSGISGMTLKAAFAAIKGVKPGYIPYVIDLILPQCLTALEPIWNEGVEKGDPVGYLSNNRSLAADALLAVTDAKAKNTTRQIVRGTYQKLRGSAKQHVEEAVPDFAKLIDDNIKA